MGKWFFSLTYWEVCHIFLTIFDGAANPFEERRNAIQLWRHHAVADVIETPEVLRKAEILQKKGLKSKDALHIACAIVDRCDCFVTTDETILRKQREFIDITVLDPTALVRRLDL